MSGGLTAWIVSGALCAAGLVVCPQPLGLSAPVPQPGGPATGVRQAPAPDVAITAANADSAAVATIKNRPSAAGLTALAQPKVEAPIPQPGQQLAPYGVETTEVTAPMDDGVAYIYWTFGRTASCPMLRTLIAH